MNKRFKLFLKILLISQYITPNQGNRELITPSDSSKNWRYSVTKAGILKISKVGFSAYLLLIKIFYMSTKQSQQRGDAEKIFYSNTISIKFPF